MYIETSSPRRRREAARLISPIVTKKLNGICLSFWYHAYGDDIGTLNVYTRVRNQLSTKPIWSIDNDQGNKWRVAAVTIDSSEDFQIVFEGIVGFGIYLNIKFVFL
jgi:hypothetical protein